MVELQSKICKDSLQKTDMFRNDDNHTREVSESVEKLRGAADLLMGDVREDISSVATILDNFSKLRRDHPSEYRSAFIGMTLPPIIGELVKLDTITFSLPYASVSCYEITKLQYAIVYNGAVVLVRLTYSC